MDVQKKQWDLVPIVDAFIKSSNIVIVIISCTLLLLLFLLFML